MSVAASEASKQSDWTGGFRAWDWRFLALVASAVFAAIIFEGVPDAGDAGSALAACYAFPFAVLCRDWLTKDQPRLAGGLLLCALMSMIALLIDPVWFNLVVAWIALVLAGLALRARVTCDAAMLASNAFVQFLLVPFAMISHAACQATGLSRVAKHLPLPKLSHVIVPLTISTVFLVLLAFANPVIEATLYRVILLDFDWIFRRMGEVISLRSIIVFSLTSVMLWPVLQTLDWFVGGQANANVEAPRWHAVYFSPSTVALTLVVLNLMFAWQNSLDVHYVWLLGQLPDTATHAEYVHRGAYTLIVTALLAAAFVLVALRQGSDTASTPLVRKLVYLWIVQNLLLVASSAQRTFSYIVEFGWTEWRISGLIWMGLVFFALVVVILRVWKDLSSRWLINVNLFATGTLLTAMTLVDVQGFAAERNVDKALSDAAYQLDYNYLYAMGPDSLPALRRFRDATRDMFLSSPQVDLGLHMKRSRIDLEVGRLEGHVHWRQRKWQSWTLRHVFLQ
jgi:Domain of unknown function (DUF4173)